jgi:hypothetical protein
MRCLENTFQSRCIYGEPHGISEPNALGVFDTQLGAQGMEGIGELQNYLAPLLP